MINKNVSHYKIIEEIGSGGMGVVYKALDTKLDRYVAIKFLPHYLSTNEKQKQRFIQEAKLASSLDHQNICNIHEIDETEDGQIYIVMGCYEGETLKEKNQRGPLEINETIQIAVQIGDGLAKAHKKGIIHRDIKPANIFITNEGVAKILDFGIAKLVGQEGLTKTETTLGTVEYMSPEQARGDQVDHQTDIWSLGVVLYEMLTGELPFKADHAQAVLYSILSEEPRQIGDIKIDLPEEISKIIDKSLSKNIIERYQNIDEFTDDLTSFSSGLKVMDSSKFKRSTIIKRPEGIIRKSIILSIIIFLLILGYVIIKPLVHEEIEPISIAIISFENQTQDESYDYLTKVIPNLLITNLEQSKYFNVKTWERMQDLLRQMGKEDVKNIDKELGFEICKMENIPAIILGSFSKLGDIFVLDAKLLDVKTKKILKSVNTKGKGEESILESQLDEISHKIAGVVGLTKPQISQTTKPLVDVTTNSIEAYNYFILGREETYKGYTNNAYKFLNKAIEIDSTFASAYIYLAIACSELRQFEKSDENIKLAMSYSENATEKERLWISSWYYSNIELNIDKCFQLASQLVERYPDDKLFRLELAQLHFYLSGREKVDLAIHEIHKVLDLDPKFRPAFFLLGMIYNHIEDFNKSLECYRQYIRAFPDEAEPYYSIGKTFLTIGEFDSAKVNFLKSLKIKTDYYPSMKNLIYLYSLKENYQKAIEWVTKFIDMSESQEQKMTGYYFKIFYHLWIGQISTGLNLLEVIKDVSERSFWTDFYYGMKARLLLEKGEYKLFKDYYRILWGERTEPYFKVRLNFLLAVADLHEDKIDSTGLRINQMKDLMKDEYYDVSFDNQRVNFFYNLLRAEIFIRKNLFNNALLILDTLSLTRSYYDCEYIGWTNFYNEPHLKDALARAYLKSGNLDKAIEEYERLTSIRPNELNRLLVYPKNHYRLAKLYEQKGWNDRAINRYKKFLKIYEHADEELAEVVDAKRRLARLEQIISN